MPHRLQGKNAIITGAAMGIGKAIATAYVRAGCRVVLLDRTPKKNYPKLLPHSAPRAGRSSRSWLT